MALLNDGVENALLAMPGLCSVEDVFHKPRPKKFPPKKPKHLPPVMVKGQVFTFRSSVFFAYGYIVDEVMDNGWTLVAERKRGWRQPLLIRWNHTEGIWVKRCCLENYNFRQFPGDFKNGPCCIELDHARVKEEPKETNENERSLL